MFTFKGYAGFENALLFITWATIALEYFYALRFRDDRWRVYAILANIFLIIADLVDAVHCFLTRDYARMGEDIAGIAFSLLVIWWLWRKFRDRKKVKELLGAKTRALRDKIAGKMREGQQPSPVRVPE